MRFWRLHNSAGISREKENGSGREVLFKSLTQSHCPQRAVVWDHRTMDAIRKKYDAVTALIVSVKALLSPVAFGVTAIAEDAQGRVLLVRHRYMRGWQLPGGGVGRNEPPAEAILRELKEEVGLVGSDAPQFVGLFSRTAGIATNVIALFRMANVQIDFRPNWEIREILFADPAAPPEGTTPATLRRLAEMNGKTKPSPFW
jgi:8-oxo-dGTP pyrophosphatase MutT (NUDIX family)